MVLSSFYPSEIDHWQDFNGGMNCSGRIVEIEMALSITCLRTKDPSQTMYMFYVCKS